MLISEDIKRLIVWKNVSDNEDIMTSYGFFDLVFAFARLETDIAEAIILSILSLSVSRRAKANTRSKNP